MRHSSDLHRVRKQAKSLKRQTRGRAPCVKIVLPHKYSGSQWIASVGPTNSGKSFEAISALDEAMNAGKKGLVFAAPLRLLAWEVFDALQKRWGDRVGLHTGEERIRTDSCDLLVCTTEATPDWGNILVVDEAHWMGDGERGPAWSRLLSAEYDTVYWLGGAEFLPLISSLTDEISFSVKKRLLPLQKDPVTYSLETLPQQSALVCFSRRDVLSYARQLAHLHGADKVACLYGAQPLGVRQREIERVRNGRALYTVCTDVIGHGVNLPLDRVVFSSLRKFDGIKMRPLARWEAAQIAGRAGRYGLSEAGWVSTLTEVEDPSGIIDSCLLPSLPVERITCEKEIVLAHRKLDCGYWFPQATDLDARNSLLICEQLQEWFQQAKEASRMWQPADIEHATVIVQLLLKATEHSPRPAADSSVDDVLHWTHCPVDMDDQEYVAWVSLLMKWWAGEGFSPCDNLPKPRMWKAWTLSQSEELCQRVVVARWVANTMMQDEEENSLLRNYENGLTRHIIHQLNSWLRESL